MSRVAVMAPAKINLGLHVLRKRPDGYHEIESILQMISLYDDLILEEAGPGIDLETGRDDLPGDEKNLVYRAAELLAEAAGRAPAVRIQLVKRIPIAAGLGGGSSDAAATLLGLDRLWGLCTPRKKLMELGQHLGMDVPFFLFSPSALARGRGEILEKLTPPSQPFWVVLVNPGFKVATEWAYQSLKIGLTIENKHISMRKFSISSLRDGGCLENDLERVTLKEYPVLQEIKDMLKRWGALEAVMSGSGPTLYGLFSNQETASVALKRFKKRKDFSVFMVHSLKAFPEE